MPLPPSILAGSVPAVNGVQKEQVKLEEKKEEEEAIRLLMQAMSANQTPVFESGRFHSGFSYFSFGGVRKMNHYPFVFSLISNDCLIF